MTDRTVTLNPDVATLASGAVTYTATRHGGPPEPIEAVAVPDGMWSVRLREEGSGWAAIAVRPLSDSSETFQIAVAAQQFDAYLAALEWANDAARRFNAAARITVPHLYETLTR